jgi:hypothetical protein
MNIHIRLAPLVLLLTACDKGPAPSAAASASAKPAVPAASSAASAPASACPAGSAGKGTVAEPCLAADAAARLVEVTYVGDVKGDKVGFKFANKTAEEISHLDVRVYFYDKDGKQLEVTDLPGMKDSKFNFWWTSGLVFGLDKSLAANETKDDVQVPLFSKERIPKGTAKVQAEAILVGFSPCKDGPCKLYWKNTALAVEKRPAQG